MTATLTKSETSLAEFEPRSKGALDEFSGQDLEPKTVRERAARLAKQMDAHFEGFPNTLDFDREALKAFFSLVQLIADSDVEKDFHPDDYAALESFARLCGELYLRGADLTRRNTWREQPLLSIARQYLRLSASFSQEPQPPRPRRKRETIENLEKQGVDDQQVCKIYGWLNKHGAPDLARLAAFKSGDYKLTDADTWLDPVQGPVAKLPRMVFVREFRAELHEKMSRK